MLLLIVPPTSAGIINLLIHPQPPPTVHRRRRMLATMTPAEMPASFRQPPPRSRVLRMCNRSTVRQSDEIEKTMAALRRHVRESVEGRCLGKADANRETDISPALVGR